MNFDLFDPDGILDRPATEMTEEEVNDTVDRGCECGSGMRWHQFGKDESCEYFEHHCEMCHERQICTIKECGML